MLRHNRSAGRSFGSIGFEWFFFFSFIFFLSFVERTINNWQFHGTFACLTIPINKQFVNILKTAMLSSGSCLNSSDDESKEVYFFYFFCYTCYSIPMKLANWDVSFSMQSLFFVSKTFANRELNEYQNGIAEFHGLISNIFDWFYWIITEWIRIARFDIQIGGQFWGVTSHFEGFLIEFCEIVFFKLAKLHCTHCDTVTL